MDEIVKKLGHGVRLKIGALADGYAAEFDREDLDETDLCSLAAAWRDDLYALGEEIVETATRATGDSEATHDAGAKPDKPNPPADHQALEALAAKWEERAHDWAASNDETSAYADCALQLREVLS